MEQNSFDTFQYLLDLAHTEWFKLKLDEINAKPHPHKWSKKEILGHLIDSAINNTGRLVIGQFEPLQVVPYNQDKWVETQNYQSYNEDDIFQTWSAVNHHLLNVVKNIKDSNWEREIQLPDGSIATLRWLFYDYIAHLKHHLRQIFGNHPEL